MDYSRNWLFIDSDLQAKLGRVRVLIMGVGIGSVFAELAVRTGIRNLTIADGDNVEASNLNRQNFTHKNIGQSKAFACGARLKDIDPGINIKIIDAYLDEVSLAREIPQADFVINTIDFDSPFFLLASRLCRQHKKIELFPMNLGFGSSVCVFTSKSDSWENFFEFKDHRQLKSQILNHLLNSSDMAPYLEEAKQKYFQNEGPGYDPQLAVSCMISSSVMLGIIINVLKGEEIHAFPNFYYLDASVPSVISTSSLLPLNKSS